MIRWHFVVQNTRGSSNLPFSYHIRFISTSYNRIGEPRALDCHGDEVALGCNLSKWDHKTALECYDTKSNFLVLNNSCGVFFSPKAYQRSQSQPKLRNHQTQINSEISGCGQFCKSLQNCSANRPLHQIRLSNSYNSTVLYRPLMVFFVIVASFKSFSFPSIFSGAQFHTNIM